MAQKISEQFQPAILQQRYQAAYRRRQNWEQHWQECYDYALPTRDNFSYSRPGAKRSDRLFDSTAADAVDQLSASLLANLTPPWSQWFGLRPGPDLDNQEKEIINEPLDIAARRLQHHFDHSNFAVEMHQCFLDLVTGGTASLLFEENSPGEASAFRFTAVPLHELVLEEGSTGALDGTYRRFELTLPQLQRRFPAIDFPADVVDAAARDINTRFAVLESVLPDQLAFVYTAMLVVGADPLLLRQQKMAQSPYINFRWLKSPGELYGRSPVMKALPDIKTANKVVELVLKNASIAVTGIWQADDDGVLNPANIRLVPGTIIPKAVGSAGLTPLGAPGRFDVSQLVLNDLRAQIRKAMLVDQLGPVQSARMTATEILERSAEMARILGATYGRLQSELLTPLVYRAVAILRRRGEIPDIALDGRTVVLDFRSPLARAQAGRDVQTILQWLQSINGLGPDADKAVDHAAVARWLGTMFGVPPHFLRDETLAPPSLPPQTAGETA